MGETASKRLLFVMRHAPYGAGPARAGLDAALAAAAFDQPVDLLFMGDGVLQLLPQQDGAALGVKTRGKQLAALPLYDIEHVYVDAQAAARYALDVTQAPLPAQALDADGMAQLLQDCDLLLGF
ncbi:MAG: sulfurtransferase complex subunit TusC [Halioglobus sp.]|nr:sulfurtransferase complex subunit TusC [Halioglobus sp.]|tara:strand:+ start:265 stop:636 length:372 start_codon:yes stop_codon:yes gene_type:complete